MAAGDPVSADAPGPWDVEPTTDRAEVATQALVIMRLSTKLEEATALAEERLAGLDRLRVECEAWQTASAGWQARCGELEGLLGEAGVRRDQYKTMYYHLRERLERAEAMRGESTPTG